jgi:hypothetical protein
MKENDTTLTPLWITEKLGPFDMDPCAYPDHPTAKILNVWPSCGLTMDWHGAVWCNPPYSEPMPWVRKMAEHNNGIMLVLASTDTAWFQEAMKTANTLHFPKGRLTFHRKDMSPVKLMRASAFIGWGESGSHLNRLKEGFGWATT